MDLGVTYMKLFQDIIEKYNIKSVVPLTKGWSKDKKYILTSDDKRYLLRVSDISLYEKKKEQEYHGEIVPEEHWTRYEMRFANNRADDFAYNYLTISDMPLNQFILSVFYQMLDIKEDNNRDTHHQANVETDPKWQEFLGYVEKYKMVKATEYEKRISYLVQCSSGTISPWNSCSFFFS